MKRANSWNPRAGIEKVAASTNTPLFTILLAKEMKIEILLKDLLSDKADRKEIFFVLNILSFLKDGKTLSLLALKFFDRKCEVLG